MRQQSGDDQSTNAPHGWTKIIGPPRPFFSVPWREIWAYRELIVLLARRDLTANHQQTILGPFWIIAQPLVTAFVFMFLFGRLGRLGTDGMPHMLFYLAGLVPWMLFADTLTKTSNVFTRFAPIFGKIYFPRLIVPLSSVATTLVIFAFQLSLFLAVFGFYCAKMTFAPDPQHPIHLDPNWRIMTMPLVLLLPVMLGLGIGCAVSALSTRYRDLSMGIGFVVPLWMFASSIVFPISRVAVENRWLFYLNPMVSVVESFRFAFLGKGLVQRWHLGMSFAICAVILATGLLLFNRAEQTAADAA